MSTTSFHESEVLLQSARLRGQARFADAIKLVEEHLPRLPEDMKENALLEIIYAALESGDRVKAVAVARTLAAIDPDIPTVRRLLATAR